MPSPAVVPEESRRFEIADILRDHAHGLRLSGPQERAVRDIVACRTERLGGHLEVCPDCGFSRGSYNSCRNRHCPKCQILKQALWAEAQEALLLPTLYFQALRGRVWVKLGVRRCCRPLWERAREGWRGRENRAYSAHASKATSASAA